MASPWDLACVATNASPASFEAPGCERLRNVRLRGRDRGLVAVKGAAGRREEHARPELPAAWQALNVPWTFEAKSRSGFVTETVTLA